MPQTRPLRREDPKELAGYRLKGLLGHGGQGTVYHGIARDGTEVAIKLLHPQFADDENSRRWLAHEFEVAGSVDGHTAKVMHSGVFNGCPYIVSEYIEGPTLAERVDGKGPFDPHGLRRLAAETIAALVAIHAVGIMHCDFKPGNILLGPDGPRVIDFGIAHALNTLSTRAGVGVGTPAYMAPEQINHQHRIGPHTDVFAWASTMVFAACGRPAFGMDEYQRDVMHHIITDEPDLSGVPEPMRELLYDCLAKDPGNRPSAVQVQERLRRGPGRELPLPFGLPAGPELTGHTGAVCRIALTTVGG
ncbi:serine/threonine-protein kinase, partial [Actinocorallia lasiicapitis]